MNKKAGNSLSNRFFIKFIRLANKHQLHRSMMHPFRVVVPNHVQGGDLIRIQYPNNGTETNIFVPVGLKGGDSFVYDPRGFLDREIVTVHDCCVALSVGLVIGCAVVVVFLCGVLFVTDPLQQPQHQVAVASSSSSLAGSSSAAAAAAYNNLLGMAATTATAFTISADGATTMATSSGAIHLNQLGSFGVVAAATASSNAAVIFGKIATPPMSCDLLLEPGRSLCVQQQQDPVLKGQNMLEQQASPLIPSVQRPILGGPRAPVWQRGSQVKL